MNALALSWIGFLGAWKAWPNDKELPRATDVLLSLLLFAGLFGILYKPRNQVPVYAALLLIPFFAFAVLSRIELKDTWDKPRERIETGPYEIISHPIYGSVFLASLVTALLTQAPFALPGLSAIGLSFVLAAHKDEKEIRAIETEKGTEWIPSQASSAMS